MSLGTIPADEGNSDFKMWQLVLLIFERFDMTHQRPDAIVFVIVVVAAYAAWHWQCEMKQSSGLCRAADLQECSKRRHIEYLR